MLITVDQDDGNGILLMTNIRIGLEYGLKLKSIKKSPSKRGYHIIWYIDPERLKTLNFILDAPADLIPVIRERLKLAENLKIHLKGNKTDILRIVLGDDENRVIYDIKRRDYLPEQVLFSKSKKFLFKANYIKH
jgi:hypothetical protein